MIITGVKETNEVFKRHCATNTIAVVDKTVKCFKDKAMWYQDNNTILQRQMVHM